MLAESNTGNSALAQRRARDRDAYYRRQGREPALGIGTRTTCASCPEMFVRTRSDHIYCKQCLRDRLNAYIRRVREEKRRAEGVPVRRGEKITCDHCGVVFEKRDIKHRFCSECRNQNQIRSMMRRKKADPAFALSQLVSAAIRKNLSGGKAGRKWESLVGYTLDDLKNHLERQFTRKMTWGNRGTYWELEHIRPICSFVIDGPDSAGFRECWCLLNLRPWPKNDNRDKGAQRLFLL